MQCADSTTVSLGEWSAPCRMCGQLLLILPDKAPPTHKTGIGTVCYECYPAFVTQRLRTLKAWDVQYTALIGALTENLPTSTARRIANILGESVLKD